MRKVKNVIKIITGVVVAACLILLLLNVIPFNTKVDKEIGGMIFKSRNGEDTAVPTYIRIKGTYSDYLINWWHEDEFVGGVVLADNPGISDGVISDSYCRPYIKENIFITLIDYYTEDGMITYYTDGWFDKDNSLFIMQIDTYYAIFPAANKEEAIQSGMALTNGKFDTLWAP